MHNIYFAEKLLYDFSESLGPKVWFYFTFLGRDVPGSMASNDQQMTEYKDSFMKMANSAFSASKTGWTRARQVIIITIYFIIRQHFILHFDDVALDALFLNSTSDNNKLLCHHIGKQLFLIFCQYFVLFGKFLVY